MQNYATLRIQGSVARAVKGNNYENIYEADFPKLESYIRRLCKNLGLKANLNTFDVWRVDLARNKELGFGVPQFIHEVRKVKAFGTLIRAPGKEFYRQTYVRWENTQREVVLYDKVEDIRKKLAKIRIAHVPQGNWLRSEVRLMRSKVTKRAAISRFKDLKDNDRHWELWKEENRRIIRKARGLGLYGPRQGVPPQEFWREVKSLATEGRQINKLIALMAGVSGISAFLDGFGGQEGFNNWVKNLDVNRSRKLRIRKAVEQIIRYRNWYVTKVSAVPIWEIYESWADAGELPPPDHRKYIKQLKAKGWSDKEIKDVLKMI